MIPLPPPRDDELLDLDALIARYGVERARARPRLVGIIGGLWSWFLGLSLAAKIFVGIVAIAGLMYVARLLQRPSFDLNVPRTYGFNARRNTTGLGLHIPIVYGEHRHFPPIINQYIDTVGDKEYLYTLYAVSEGPIERISDVEVNDQPIERYQEVSWQARLGTPDQEAIPWFADTRNTYAVGVELLDDGRSFIYRTLRRVDRFIVKVKIPAAGGAAGLSTSSMSMTVRVEHRREGDAAWIALPDVVITANTRKPVTRQIDSGDLGQVARAYAGTVQNDSALSGTAWANPANAQGAPNDTWASVNEPTSTPRDTQYLRSSGHGFAVPGGATITGIELRVERHHVPEGASGPPDDWLPEGPFSSFDRSVRLCRAGAVVGEDKAVTGTAWPLTDTLRIYGGPGDLWGETWTPSDVNDSGFGAALAARVDLGTCRVDAMELRVYYTLAGADLARREIRVTRVTTSTSDKPPLSFDSVDEILYGTDLNRYANVAVLGVKIQASEQLSGEPKISALVRGRKVRPLVSGALDPTEIWTRNPVECLVDLLTHARYGLGRGGLTDDHLVLSSFQLAKDYCDELIDRGDGTPEVRHEFDAVIDEKTIWEWVQDLIPNVFRGGLVESDGRYRLFFDHLTPISQVFTDANIVRGTFETSWLSISEQYDQVELFYLDRDQYYFRDSVLFPATGTKRKVIEARGITRRTHATREARYHYHQTSLLARSVQFDASLDAIACDVGDVIGVSHSLPHSGDPTSPWAFSGRVVAVATADAGANHVITVDRGDLPTEGLGSYGLLVRLQDDTIAIKDTVLSVSAPYTSAEGYPRQDVKVSGLFAATPAARDSLWAFGPVTQVTQPFRVLALTLNANRTRKITAFEYREFADEVPIYEPPIVLLDIYVTSYTGNGSGQTIPLPWDADVVLIRRRQTGGGNEAAGIWRVRARDSGANSQYIQEFFNYTNLITALGTASFSVGTGSHVNAHGVPYDAVAFREGPAFRVITWVGNGDAGGQIVDFPFAPRMIWVQGAVVPRATFAKTEDMGTVEGRDLRDSNPQGDSDNGLHRITTSQFRAKGTLNTNGLTCYALAWGPAANVDYVPYLGTGSDDRIIPVAIQKIDWAFLQTAQTIDSDKGATMRISGYDETDISGQIISGTPSKPDFIQRLLSSSVEVGVKGNVIAAGLPNRLFVARMP